MRSGKALYAGISSYPAEQTATAAMILRTLGTPCLIHQPSYSMINRWVEGGLLDTLEREGIGCIAFSPLAQGMLTDKYLEGIPADSRVARGGALRREFLSADNLARIRSLDAIARRRDQNLAQMALAWVLKDQRITSVIIGASRPAQIEDCVRALAQPAFAAEELGVGCIAFSPLAQGMLSAKYLDGIPPDARAGKGGSLRQSFLSEENLARVRGLDAIARRRGQSLAQMAIAWVLRDPRVTSALIGARSVEQLDDSLDAAANLAFDAEELREIDAFAQEGDVDLWAGSEALLPADLPKPRLGARAPSPLMGEG